MSPDIKKSEIEVCNQDRKPDSFLLHLLIHIQIIKLTWSVKRAMIQKREATVNLHTQQPTSGWKKVAKGTRTDAEKEVVSTQQMFSPPTSISLYEKIYIHDTANVNITSSCYTHRHSMYITYLCEKVQWQVDKMNKMNLDEKWWVHIPTEVYADVTIIKCDWPIGAHHPFPLKSHLIHSCQPQRNVFWVQCWFIKKKQKIADLLRYI